MQTTANYSPRALLVLLAVCVPLSVTCADVVTLRPVADTSLLETVPNNNLGGQSFLAAGTTQNNTKTRGLLLFDFTQIPVNTTISAVTLQVEVTQQPADGYAISAFGLHRMLVSWGEGNKIAANPLSPGQGAPATAGEATWNQRFVGTTPWSLPGAKRDTEFVTAPSSVEVIYNVGSSPYHFQSTAELVADVQSWVNDPQGNHGWMLMTEAEGTPFTARRFGSREDVSRAPLLTVEFSVVPEPGTLALLGAGLLLLARGRRAVSKG